MGGSAGKIGPLGHTFKIAGNLVLHLPGNHRGKKFVAWMEQRYWTKVLGILYMRDFWDEMELNFMPFLLQPETI